MNKFRMAKAGIMVNDAIKRLCGDAETYETLLLDYLNDPHYGKLQEALTKKDVDEAFQAAHALKGVAGNLSLSGVFDAVNPIVETLRGGSLEVEEYLPALEEANEKVIAAIKDMAAH